MRAVVVHGAEDLRLEERELDTSTGSVVVRPVVGGICGSDLHYVASGRVGAFAIQEPLVLGHEVVGIVESGGDDAFPRGTRVAVHPATPDASCPECRAGVPNVCRHGRYLGSAATFPHTQGGFAERIAVRPDQLRRIPDELPLHRAVLAEPLAVGLHAINRAGGVRGRRVLVTGGGPIGLLAAGAAVVLGAAFVTVTDLLPRPLQIAEQLGAGRTIDLRDASVPDESADVVLEASGSPAAVSAAAAAAVRRGLVIQIGMLPGEPRPIALAPLIAKEVALLGSFRFDSELDAALAMLGQHQVLERVVSHRFSVDEVHEAFAVAADPAISSKVVLDLS